MILECYSVMDKAVKSFLQPFFARSRGEALRSFTEVVNTKDHQFNRHVSDYTLYFCGRWDDASGCFESSEPVRVVSGLEVLVDDIFPPDRELRPAPLTNGSAVRE